MCFSFFWVCFAKVSACVRPLQNPIFLIVVKNKFLKFQSVIFFRILKFEGFAKVSSKHKMDTSKIMTQKENRLNNCLDGLNLAPRAGLEPATCGLTVRKKQNPQNSIY